MTPRTAPSRALFAVLVPALLLAGGMLPCSAEAPGASPNPSAGAPSPAPGGPSGDSVTLTDSQLRSISVARVTEREFPVEQEAVGAIDFNEDRTVQVFTPYAGRIASAHFQIGDDVKKGDVLFTLESPDFISAESSLISAAATLVQTTSALLRARALYESKAIDENDYEAAVANQESAEGALRAARHEVAMFGKTPAEIDAIVATRTVQSDLVVKSPIAGRVTARTAAPGLYVQPGNPPPPYTVTDLSSVWMVAEVPEIDAPRLKPGEPLTVTVSALPGRVFTGRIIALGASIDPSSRRLMVRAEVKDAKHELLPGMFADFHIEVAPKVRAPAVPANGVVREGDGTMSVWVVGADPHRFVRRIVTLGSKHDGFDEIRQGLAAGETVAIDGAIFLSNILYGGAT